ncbi:MAG: hypothetical protein SV377_01270 [Halobacteria archaeon]|nr:hypothetical protein [Halobacteria archaeon]
MGEASRKVEGGKLVKVKVEDNSVTILGDFFMHPEESIEGLERRIAKVIDSETEYIESEIRDYFEENKVRLLGASPRDIAELVSEATKK